ncbi:MAG: chemotaxis protein CheC [Lachnospiraceae bacterium]|nr:chemotaxis protein CheC [Lachnospiraceae bacterium]MDY3818294.1 chemotaxis protein CheC [Lachnospiraceae bacterium]
MGFENLNELNAMHLDVLREIGNIGSGNAATSLASMLNTTVDIEVPTISLVNYDHVSQYLGGKDRRVVGLAVGLEGDIDGVMLHVVQRQFVSRIINTFYPKEINTLDDINSMDLSAVKETSNITTAAYVNSLASLTNTFINITPPTEYIDTVENVLSKVSSNFEAVGNQVIYIDENLIIAGSTIKSSMILILEIDSLKRLFDKMGIPY